LKIYAQKPIHSIHGDGSKPETRPFGLFGGKPGAANRCLFHFPDGTTLEADLKENYDLQPDTVLECFAGGGGGFGDPRKRDPAKVAADIQDGLISIATARRDYGVAVDSQTIELDEQATAGLRAQREKGMLHA
jgi:N-methylhydantoinase B